MNLTSNTPRSFKQPQLWLYGPTNIGKSTLINNLEKYFRIYHIPTEDWYCEYKDNDYDIAVLDEYCGSKTIGFLNKWLEGGTFPLRQRNKASYNKKQNIPTIICSNLSPSELYQKCAAVQIDALVARLCIVFSNDRIDFEYVSEARDESINN